MMTEGRLICIVVASIVFVRDVDSSRLERMTEFGDLRVALKGLARHDRRAVQTRGVGVLDA